MKQQILDNWQEYGFGLYIHWPFCASKCPYCDFNSHVRARIDQGAWKQAYLSEISRAAQETPGRVLKSIYFGGGTPSLMKAEVVQAIIDEAARSWSFANDIEITLEANPTSVEVNRLRSYRLAGVNRVSLGLQALNDADLRRLGRQHSAAEGLAALDVAQSIFDRISCDLIYARQNQSLDSWQHELEDLFTYSPDHISLYQLTIEPNTAFGALHKKGKLSGLPDEDLAADLYDITAEICENHGLRAYEISNYARPGSESRHNMIYWQMGDYIGIGPGAHGRISTEKTRYATETILNPELWLNAVNDFGNGEKSREILSLSQQAMEYLLMNLRLTDGMSLARYVALNGQPLVAETIAKLDQDGLITVDQDRLKATVKGRILLNQIILELSEN